MNDADLDKAVEAVIGSKFRNAGQTCICTNRVFVQEEVYEVFAEKFQKAVGQLKVGDGFGDGTTHLLTRMQFRKYRNILKMLFKRWNSFIWWSKGCRARRTLYATNCNWIGE